MKTETLLDKNKNEKSEVILVSVMEKGADRAACEASFDELERLAETAGATVYARMVQEKENPDPRTYIGSGKVKELAELCKNGELKLLYKQQKGSPEQTVMEYRYDEQTKTLYVKGKLGVWRLDKSFSLANGELGGEMKLGAKNVVVKFKR